MEKIVANTIAISINARIAEQGAAHTDAINTLAKIAEPVYACMESIGPAVRNV